MTDFHDDPARAEAARAQRVGSADRSGAIAALNTHLDEGRLDPTEHERRTTRAKGASTRADLEALFTDLPEPGPWPDPRATASAGGPARPPMGQPPGPAELADRSYWDGPHYGRAGQIAVGLAPIVALALFFTLHSWLWFLLIPVVGTFVYGGDRDQTRRSSHRKDRR